MINQGSTSVVGTAMNAIVPAQKIGMAEWLRDRFRMPDGRPFQEQLVPWVTAPNGPCDAIDNPQIRTLYLQWAARCFKTNLGQAMQMMRCDVSPCSLMFATVDELLCKAIFGRLWESLAECPTLRHEVPPEKLQSKTEIKLLRSKIYGAWSRGQSRLADKSIECGHGNEIDKWVMLTTSKEGDPLPRFLKRGGEHADRKFLLESTPSERKKSRVENGRLRSTNCGLQVPCPHCGRFQVLRRGDGRSPGGLYWPKLYGKSDPDHAFAHAYYVCLHCEESIYDKHRPEMLMHCVWVDAGCTVDDALAIRARELPQFDRSWMQGTPDRRGDSWGSQLSYYYALFHGWGSMAKDYLEKRRKIDDYKQHVNEDMGETWQRDFDQVTWESLLEKTTASTPRDIVPEGFSRLTIGIDKQETEPMYPYVVLAWAPGWRWHVVRYGYVDTEEELEAVLKMEFAHADGGEPVQISRGLMDSGFRPKGVGEFCQRMRRKKIKLLPCKGSSSPLNVTYKRSRQGKDSAMPGQVLIRVDTWTTQDWVDNEFSAEPEECRLTLYQAHQRQHEDFAQQAVNDGPQDKNGNLIWDAIDDDIPNDYRDCMRYGYVAALLEFRGADPPDRIRQSAPPPKQKEKERFVRRPTGGRKFVRKMRRR